MYRNKAVNNRTSNARLWSRSALSRKIDIYSFFHTLFIFTNV